MTFQGMFDAMKAAYERDHPGEPDPIPPIAADSHFADLPPVDPDVPSAHVLYAFNPHQAARSNGGYHLVLDQPLAAGRLIRNTGDALCKPADRFWGLERGNDRQNPTCPLCTERARRYGITVRMPRK